MPAYKAGGPIQSLYNLAELCNSNDISIYILTSNKEYDGTLLNVEANSFVQHKSNVFIYYASSLNVSIYKRLLKKLNPNVVYLNGMFSFRFTILPLLFTTEYKIILSPRGMLQKGALAGKKIKKMFFLNLLKKTGLLKNIFWHATDEQEKADIQRLFNVNNEIFVVPNVPKPPIDFVIEKKKKNHTLRLVYLSLIAEKKNLHLAMNAVSNVEGVTLDIYGPIKDTDYWNTVCKPFMHNSKNIAYCGDVKPAKVQKTIADYDAFILLSKGENFGHAIYESLSTGTPVIISDFTPWQNLEHKKAGVNVDYNDMSAIEKAIVKFRNLNQEEINSYSHGAYKIASDYYYQNNFIKMYKELFS